MKAFADWAVRTKILAIVLTSALVPILAGLGVVLVRDLRLLERELITTLETVARAAARYSAADLAFENQEAAAQTLSRLGSVPYLRHAALYDASGRLFASHAVVPGSRAPERLAEPAPGVESRFEGAYLDVTVPVVEEGVRYGTLRLESSTEPVRGRLREQLAVLLLLSLAIASLAVALAFALERRVSRPVLRLARVAHKVSEGDYTVRAPKLGADEIGALSDAFNAMLAAIQRRQADAEEAVRIRDEFISVASHELKTPLTSLKLQAQLLRRNLSGDRPIPSVDVGHRLDLVERSLGRLDRLVGDLLDVSAIRAGRMPMHLEELELGALAADVAEMFRTACDREHTPIVTRLEPGVSGRWDRLRLEQVLVNLIGNAAKFGAGRPVEVEVSSAGDRARLVVRDHGIGIPAADLERVFGLYERAVSTRSYGGFGLGLYITRTIVRALGGTISVASVEGEGATFTVQLPRSGPDRADG